jgi:hypothetical protein
MCGSVKNMKSRLENVDKLPQPSYHLTERGVKVIDTLKGATMLAIGVTAVALACDTVGPKETVAETSITLGGLHSREGDISTIGRVVEDLGYNPNEIRGVVAEGQSLRKEAERAGTDVGTVKIYESLIFNNKSVDVSFKSNANTN